MQHELLPVRNAADMYTTSISNLGQGKNVLGLKHGRNYAVRIVTIEQRILKWDTGGDALFWQDLLWYFSTIRLSHGVGRRDRETE